MEIRPETENNLDRLSIYNQEMVENMGCEELDVGPVYRPLQAEAGREALTSDLLEADSGPIGYATWQLKQNHFDSALRTVFIRHFYIDRLYRRSGNDRQSLDLL